MCIRDSQYTVPKEQYLDEIRNGQTPDVDGYKGHLRECYVVAAPDADKAKIENEIKTMENYFVGYETVVHFISQEELDRDHKGIPHGGFVLRSGESTDGTRHVIEYSCLLYTSQRTILYIFHRVNSESKRCRWHKLCRYGEILYTILEPIMCGKAFFNDGYIGFTFYEVTHHGNYTSIFSH